MLYMACKSIITIGRQYGSGGHEIGEKLAKELGINFTIKSCLTVQPKKAESVRNCLNITMKNQPTVFCILLIMDTYSLNGASSGYSEMPLNYKVFLAQFNAIKQIAKEGPCIMIGRCADYALADYENCISIFVHADMDVRIRRIARKYALTDAKGKRPYHQNG
mgnify:CR=1 FL=1